MFDTYFSVFVPPTRQVYPWQPVSLFDHSVSQVAHKWMGGGWSYMTDIYICCCLPTILSKQLPKVLHINNL